MSNNTTNEELEFWEENRFPNFIENIAPNKVPDIDGVKELLKHVEETGDYYAVVERINALKGKKK